LTHPRPVSQVLLRIEKSLNDEITTDSGLKLYLDSSYRREWNASVTATIAELPLNPNPKDKKILANLKVGDEVIINYSIVADFEFQGDGERFMPTTEGNDYIREFVNGNGEWIRCYALPTKKGIAKIIWAGSYQDRFRKVISGVQGTQSEMERWLSQFQIGKTDIYTFNNFFSYNGKDYWKCNPDNIFAKRVKNHLIAVGDRVICKPIDEDVPPELLQNVQHHLSVKVRYQDRAKVLSGGKIKGIKKDEIVSFKPTHVEKYEIYGRQYYLINENMVTGKWQSGQ
jgi:hypothetical protein